MGLAACIHYLLQSIYLCFVVVGILRLVDLGIYSVAAAAAAVAVAVLAVIVYSHTDWFVFDRAVEVVVCYTKFVVYFEEVFVVVVFVVVVDMHRVVYSFVVFAADVMLVDIGVVVVVLHTV